MVSSGFYNELQKRTQKGEATREKLVSHRNKTSLRGVSNPAILPGPSTGFIPRVCITRPVHVPLSPLEYHEQNQKLLPEYTKQ